MTPEAQKKSKRLLELDGLRGLAALAVVVCHYSAHCKSECAAIDWNFYWGTYGAHLFFVISGFVIFMTIGRCKSAMDFVFSRVSRLYPTYWLAVLFSSCIILVTGLEGYSLSWKQVVGNLTMCQT